MREHIKVHYRDTTIRMAKTTRQTTQFLKEKVLVTGKTKRKKCKGIKETNRLNKNRVTDTGDKLVTARGEGCWGAA